MSLLFEHYDVADYFMQAQFNEITILSPVHVNTLQRRARLGSPFSNLARPGSRQSVDSRRQPSRGSEPSTFSPPRTPMADSASRPETPRSKIYPAQMAISQMAQREEAAIVIKAHIEVGWRTKLSWHWSKINAFLPHVNSSLVYY